MKKIISIFLTVVLLVAFCVIPTSAATSKSEWTKQNGPGKIEFGEKGAKCVLDHGLTFFKYTKQTINIKDFSCTFFVEQEKFSGSFYAMTLNASKAYAGTGSYGLFILLRFREEGVVNVEGQILHVGYYLTDAPLQRNINIKVDTSKPLVLKGKDNGNGTYTLSFEGGTGEYTFEIPENYQFTEDLNGEGYFSFGGSSGEEENRTITVTSINDIDFSGSKPEVSSSTPTSSNKPSANDTTSSDEGLIIGGDVQDTTTTGQDTEEGSSNTALVIVIIVCAVLVIGVAVAVIIVTKKKSAVNEENAEDSNE